MDTIPQDDTPRKRCANPDCHQWYPATNEFFNRHIYSPGGLDRYCRTCSIEKTRRSRANRKANPQPPREKVPDGYKRCAMCPEGHQLHPATLEFFPRSNNRKNGLDAYCKSCKSKKQKAFYSKPENKAKLAILSHRNYEENKVDRQQKHHEWKEQNREYNLEWNRQYAREHREDIIEYKQQWRQTEQGKAYIRSDNLNRRARKLAADGEHTAEEIQQQYKRQKGKCYYCGKKLGKGKNAYHVDHTFPLSREGARNDIDSLVITCPSCNTSKGDKYPWEWPQGGRLF